MITGYLVSPDLSHRTISFERDHAQQFLGGVDETRIEFALREEGTEYPVIFNPNAREQDGTPNPLASLGRSVTEAGNAHFFLDPARAIFGSIIFLGAEGGDITDEEITDIDYAITAVRNYMKDYPEDHTLWYSAAVNMGR